MTQFDAGRGLRMLDNRLYRRRHPPPRALVWLCISLALASILALLPFASAD